MRLTDENIMDFQDVLNLAMVSSDPDFRTRSANLLRYLLRTLRNTEIPAQHTVSLWFSWDIEGNDGGEPVEVSSTEGWSFTVTSVESADIRHRMSIFCYENPTDGDGWHVVSTDNALSPFYSMDMSDIPLAMFLSGTLTPENTAPYTPLESTT